MLKKAITISFTWDTLMVRTNATLKPDIGNAAERLMILEAHAFIPEAGRIHFEIGASSADIRTEADYKL